MNPFKYGQIVKNDDFCQRPELAGKLAGYIKRGLNVYVQGERRIGKSSLICETLRKLKKYRQIYIDLLEVKTVDDFIKRIVTAIISMERASGFLDRVLKKLSHVKPVVSIDPLTNVPTVTVDASVRFTVDSISGVMDLIESYHSKTKPLIVVFDEFQDILNLKDSKATLAQLRSKVQFHSDIAYIFAGSIRNKMDVIFNDPDQPFFKSAVPLQVGPLDKETFQKFVMDKFQIGKRQITTDALNHIFKISFHVPGDIQQLCDALWDITSYGDKISAEQIPAALEQIFAQESKGYETILKIISAQQLNVLTGLARIGGKTPTSSVFLIGSGIPQASSVKTAINRLINLKIIFYHEDEYRFVNPFFRAWLLYKNL